MRMRGSVMASPSLRRDVGRGACPICYSRLAAALRRHGSSNHHVKAGTGARIQRVGRLRGPRRRPRRGRRDGGRRLPRLGAPPPPGRGGRRSHAPDVRRQRGIRPGPRPEAPARVRRRAAGDRPGPCGPRPGPAARRSRAILLDDRGAPAAAGARAPSRPVAIPRVRRLLGPRRDRRRRPPARPAVRERADVRAPPRLVDRRDRPGRSRLPDLARGAARGPAVPRRDRRHAPAHRLPRGPRPPPQKRR